jgi:two-component sensor histidine kinase
MPKRRPRVSAAKGVVSHPAPKTASTLQSASTLGLKIVWILTERLGARITVENAPGAVFTLSVPLASPDTA